jgi:molecular chaperone GrpE
MEDEKTVEEESPEGQSIPIDEAPPEAEAQAPSEAVAAEGEVEPEAALAERVAEMNDKYVRLYAEFENYRKRVQKDREELSRYAFETVFHELLPTLDNLEIALQHAGGETSDGLVKGVEASLREMRRTLEKFGLTPIEALWKPFDPAYHHAMTRVERADVEENTVVEEFRKGYMYRDRVLRASLVAVSYRPSVAEAAENSDKQSSKEEQ